MTGLLQPSRGGFGAQLRRIWSPVAEDLEPSCGNGSNDFAGLRSPKYKTKGCGAWLTRRSPPPDGPDQSPSRDEERAGFVS